MTVAVSAVDEPASARLDPHLRRLALVVVLGAIATVLDTTIVNLAIATLARSFSAPLSVVQWTLTGYTLALCMSIPLTGWAVRRFGTKTMWMVSLALFIAGSVLCGAAWSIGSLIFFRLLQGLGGGMLMPVGQTLLARAAGPRRLGRMMSALTVPATLAPMLGPVLGGLIVANISWRWIFYINVPLCAVALIAAARVLPTDQERKLDERVDLAGLVLLSPALALIVYGLAHAGQSAAWFYGGGGAGLALAALFVLRSVHRTRRGRLVLLDVTALRTRSFGTAMGSSFLYGVAIFGLLVVLPVYYQTVQHRTTLIAGLLMAPLGLGAMLAIPISGRITDRSGARWVAAGGLLTVAAGTAVFTQISTQTGPAPLVGAMFVVGVGHGLITPSLLAGAMRDIDRPAIPAASTTANILARVANAVGTALFAVVVQIEIRHSVPGAGGQLAAAEQLRGPRALAELTSAFSTTFWWVFGLTVAAVVPALLVPAVRPPSAKESA